MPQLLSKSHTELEGSFGFLLHDVARLIRRHFNHRVQVLGLTQAQCRVLLHLSRNEGIQQVALAEILEVQPMTLARQLDKLETAGLIERRRDESDRRAFCLSLTASAHPLLEKIWLLAGESREIAVGHLPPEVMTQFISTLQTMKDNLLRVEIDVLDTKDSEEDKV